MFQNMTTNTRGNLRSENCKGLFYRVMLTFRYDAIAGLRCLRARAVFVLSFFLRDHDQRVKVFSRKDAKIRVMDVSCAGQ